MEIFKKLIFLLSFHERKQAALLFIMIFIMSIIDMLGVASIFPFIAVLTNPSIIETNIILNRMFQISTEFGVETSQEFLFFLGVLVFCIITISLSFKFLTIYAQSRFIYMREYSISKRLIEGYLHQSYSWFLSQNSSDLGKTILSEVGTIVGSGIKPLILIIANTILVAVLILLIIVVDPQLALIIGLTFGLSYFSIFHFIHKYLDKIGVDRLKSNQLRFKSISEAFGAIKEIKARRRLEKTYIKDFTSVAHIYSKTFTSSQILGQLPRFILEAIAFGGIVLIILYEMTVTATFNEILPIISLYVFTGYRLMPALQVIYGSFTQLAFVGPSIDKIYNDLKNLKPDNINDTQSVFSFNKAITLKNIYFSYPNSSKVVLKDINLTIPKKSIIGLTGPTGCGKTTVVDIILGLLHPQKGSLQVDEKIVTEENSTSWQRIIGYVPQHIYLSDDTIMANIALGENTKNINYEMLKRASKIAKIDKFILDELPEEYQTKVGERGVRLSGGQLQRIGIARALYHNPKILILDEATSALDNETEKMVIEEISNLNNDITIIMITHRLNTLKICNSVFKFEKDQIIQEIKHKFNKNI